MGLASKRGMRHAKNNHHSTQQQTVGQAESVVGISRMLAMSCARYRTFRDLDAPDFVLKMEMAVMIKHMCRLVRAECGCVN
jgi:hypothetical protein